MTIMVLHLGAEAATLRESLLSLLLLLLRLPQQLLVPSRCMQHHPCSHSTVPGRRARTAHAACAKPSLVDVAVAGYSLVHCRRAKRRPPPQVGRIARSYIDM